MYSFNPERMTENIKEEQVSIKKELSNEDDTCTMYLKEADVKVEITEVQGRL